MGYQYQCKGKWTYLSGKGCCYIFPNGNFTEASHLGGRGHLIELCRIFEKAEQEGKCNSGRRLPMRVDHGMTFTDEPGGVFDESNHGHNQTAGILC